jgi:putative acetyltransferase
MSNWVVRPEMPGDESAISHLITGSFAAAEHSDGTEARIVERLRASGMLATSLVADSDSEIVGQAAFSRVSVSDGSSGWYGLGPVAVAPHRQREGIGSALIEAGLAELRQLGAAGCVVLGEPSYYSRFGFAHDPALTYPGPPPEYFQCVVLAGERARGVVRYAPAFG